MMSLVHSCWVAIFHHSVVWCTIFHSHPELKSYLVNTVQGTAMFLTRERHFHPPPPELLFMTQVCRNLVDVFCVHGKYCNILRVIVGDYFFSQHRNLKRSGPFTVRPKGALSPVSTDAYMHVYLCSYIYTCNMELSPIITLSRIRPLHT